MIRVNLHMLLAERNMTATQLSKETGISKTTLSNLVNNTSGGIQFKTIDKICMALGIEPKDFFDYSPYLYKVDKRTPAIKLESEYNSHYDNDSTFNLELIIKKNKIEEHFPFDVYLNDNENKFIINLFFDNHIFFRNSLLRMFLNDVSYSNLLGFKETIIDFVFSAIPKHSENSGSELSDEDLNKARDRTVIQIGSINQQGDIEYFKKTVTYGM